MKKVCVALSILTLCGCIDMGRVGFHPVSRMVDFDGHQNDVANCLQDSAVNQHLSMNYSDMISGGTTRYKLKDANYEDVAWIDLSESKRKEVTAFFFYAPDSPEIKTAILAMISQCKNSLR